MLAYYHLGGTIRAAPPAETFLKVEPHLSRMGITRLADITGLDVIGIPVHICYRPNSKSLSCSQGKGINRVLSKVSAIMEAVEHYHCENISRGDLFGCYEKLKSDYNVLDPKKLSTKIFTHNELELVKMEWIIATNLFSAEKYYIPKAYIDFDTSKLNELRAVFHVRTTGLSSGNTQDEAIVHALHEIIERNCELEYRTKNLQDKLKTNISIESIDGEITQQLLAKLTNAGINTKIFDVSNDIGIPTYHCYIQNATNSKFYPTFSGWGCHIDKHVALIRALTEAAQSRLTLIAGARDDITASLYKPVFINPLPQPPSQGSCSFADRESYICNDIASIKSLLLQDIAE